MFKAHRLCVSLNSRLESNEEEEEHREVSTDDRLGVGGEVPRGEKMLYSGTDPESYITEYTQVYEDNVEDFRSEMGPKSRRGPLCGIATFEQTCTLRTTTSQKCAAVPRRARMSGS